MLIVNYIGKRAQFDVDRKAFCSDLKHRLPERCDHYVTNKCFVHKGRLIQKQNVSD